MATPSDSPVYQEEYYQGGTEEQRAPRLDFYGACGVALIIAACLLAIVVL